MKIVSDKLTVVFENSDDVAGICVSRVVNGKTTILKMELREQAYILYRLLTEQTTKAEIKVESDEVLEQDTVPFDFELYQAGLMGMPTEMIKVLDNIRAEIIQVANEEKVHDERWALGLKYATKIIDKYKTESEDNKVIK